MYTTMQQVELFFQERKGFGIQPGLDRMYKLLESQQNPHEKVKVIHIAGTNGKGSTLTYINDALIENGYRVGVFTSPSLTLNGYILINNQPIQNEYFLQLLNRLIPTIQELDKLHQYPTEFEIITTIAFMYFAESVDIAIVEAGMGGREDATNCIKPILSIITNIAMDHAHFLGDTLEKIAYHKAGIIKENTPTVFGNINNTCEHVLKEEALRKNAKVFQLDHQYQATFQSSNLEGQQFTWQYGESVQDVIIQMKGLHQVENAATALMALHLVNRLGFPLGWKQIKQAFHHAQIAGRFEKVSNQPVIYVDGAHNPDGMKAFLRTIQSDFGEKRKHLVFAGFRDKELRKMLSLAIPYFDSVIITSFESSRAEEAEVIARDLLFDKVSTHSNWRDVVLRILSQEHSHDYFFFAGSLHFIGLVRAFVKENKLSQFM